jgi:hypothetical protein
VIDIDTPDSPGYWLNRCAKELLDPDRVRRLQGLYDRCHGNPPLPKGSENAEEVYKALQRKARTNFEEMIVLAAAERMKVSGVQTAAVDDDEGDEVAKRIFDENGLDSVLADAFDSMLSLSEGYVIVGDVDPDSGVPIITDEDPRQVITIHDPVQPRKVLAGLKMFHDPDQGRDLAYLYLPGEDAATVHKAFRTVKRSKTNCRIAWSPKTWEWDTDDDGETTPQTLKHKYVPVVRLLNRKGIGEFEHEVDTCDRIRHTILNRMVITIMQAFRQMAIKGDLPTHDDQGREIDYNQMFVAGPGALWELPAGAELWESAVTDIRQLLDAVKDDIRDLSATTRTPLSFFIPDAANGSAEGAALMREGLVFKVWDRISRVTPALVDIFYLAFLTMEDTERADRTQIKVLWTPPERQSLAEKADAASKTQDMSARWRMRHIWGMDPDEITAEMANRATDALLNEQVVPA